MDAIKNSHGEALDFSFTNGETSRSALVIIGHGVTANKDRSWAQSLAQALSDAGYATLRFSFSGNGESEGDFRESTVSKEVEDLGAVIEATGRGRVIYVGHSMGGAVGVLSAARDGRITQLVSLAGMVHTKDFAERKFGRLEPGNDVMWDKPECPLSPEFMDDMAHVNSVLERADHVRVPWLLVHGTADSVVPVDESREIAARAKPSVTLVEIEGADHLFSDHEKQMSNAVVEWLQERVES